MDKACTGSELVMLGLFIAGLVFVGTRPGGDAVAAIAVILVMGWFGETYRYLKRLKD